MPTVIGGKQRQRVRCPACGQRLTDPTAVACPLCRFSFGDNRVTGDDITPYAEGYATGQSAWRTMLLWVWQAGPERFKHLALMRTSSAARRFARWHIGLLVFMGGLFLLTRLGWHLAPASVEENGFGTAVPAGDGWVHVAEATRPLPLNWTSESPADLFWNGPQALIVLGLAWSLGALLAWLATALMRYGVTRAHRQPFHTEERMTAGLHYVTAWSIPLLLAAAVELLQPLAYIGKLRGLSLMPGSESLHIVAGTIAAIGVGLWWLALGRLGASAPMKTRSRVAAFFAVGAPLIAIACTAAWYVGITFLHGLLAKMLHLTFQAA